MVNVSTLQLSIVLIGITLICVSASEIKCKPSHNEKWNAKKQKCVECPDCRPGFYRNLNESYTGPTGNHGAERCIKCRECPAGTYSISGYGECMKCRMNCAEFHRETAEPCTTQHDAKCGSCLNGYYDMYKNTLFPCAPNSERPVPRLLPPRREPDKKSDDVPDNKIVADNSENKESSSDQGTIGSEPKQGSSEGATEKTSFDYVQLAIFSGLGMVGVALSIGLVVKLRSRRSRAMNTRRLASNGQYGFVPGQDLSKDDIEMDTLAQNDQSDAALYNPSRDTHFPITSFMQNTHSMELVNALPIQVRPELSAGCPTNQLNGILNSEQTRLLSVCEHSTRDVCKCRKTIKCQCSAFTFSDDINLEKSDKYILKVAESICHDPIPLFDELGLDESVIYQENHTRELDPENISQKTLVINLLHKWIEIKSKPTTLKQLSQALCKASFHNINEKLYNLSINNAAVS